MVYLGCKNYQILKKRKAYTNNVYTLPQLTIRWVFHYTLLKVIGGIIVKGK